MVVAVVAAITEKKKEEEEDDELSCREKRVFAFFRFSGRPSQRPGAQNLAKRTQSQASRRPAAVPAPQGTILSPKRPNSSQSGA
ncbi:hypothetical protein PIB30_042683 [Stylosanthes scabra]|uniref:Uncharacterized protein n=1 Tax=Stylosanthes scabra TaxID=79078 RepID=A0ABU6VDR0_9FABA|nr:hypothetical protein [Stylosanthes scabra]